MSHRDQIKSARIPVGSLLRPQYEAGNYLASDDLLTEQNYRRQRLRRHGRFLHGGGVVCGLRVVPAGDPARPWAIIVCPGYAITCCGDEVEVSVPTRLDIREYIWARPQIGGKPVPLALIGIRYAEEQTSPVAARAQSCRCRETIHHSRIRDGFHLDVLWSAPSVTEKSFDLCAGESAPCPECGESRHIILSRVSLPESESTRISVKDIS